MKKEEKIETEGFHNQAITQQAAQRMKSKEGTRLKKKVVALQLDEREQAALTYLGGIDALKKLLCPEGICLKCRQAPCEEGTPFNSLCRSCTKE